MPQNARLTDIRSRSDAELNILGWRITDPSSGDRVNARHIKNLICLAEGLAAKPRDHPTYKTLPVGPEKGWWRWGDSLGISYVVTPPDLMPPICDTASRALGHATEILCEPLATEETWQDFQRRVFGPLSADAESYVFSVMWEKDAEEHPHDVADRIVRLLGWVDRDETAQLAARAPGMMRG